MKETLKKHSVLLAVLLVMVLFLYRKTAQSILNFPLYLNLVLLLLSFVAVGFWLRRYFQQEQEGEQDNITKWMYVLYVITLATLFFLALKVPVNYYIMHASRNNPAETIQCPVTYYSKSVRKQSKYIAYLWNDKKYRLNVDEKSRNQLRTTPGTPEWMIVLTVRNSILNTKVIEHYELELK
ncbi:MAG: hypothetical protein U0T77_01060 [Chitinophagales bacterium]